MTLIEHAADTPIRIEFKTIALDGIFVGETWKACNVVGWQNGNPIIKDGEGLRVLRKDQWRAVI